MFSRHSQALSFVLKIGDLVNVKKYQMRKTWLRRLEVAEIEIRSIRDVAMEFRHYSLPNKQHILDKSNSGTRSWQKNGLAGETPFCVILED